LDGCFSLLVYRIVQIFSILLIPSKSEYSSSNTSINKKEVLFCCCYEPLSSQIDSQRESMPIKKYDS
jgi:hypothetical protein